MIYYLSRAIEDYDSLPTNIKLDLKRLDDRILAFRVIKDYYYNNCEADFTLFENNGQRPYDMFHGEIIRYYSQFGKDLNRLREERLIRKIDRRPPKFLDEITSSKTLIAQIKSLYKRLSEEKVLRTILEKEDLIEFKKEILRVTIQILLEENFRTQSEEVELIDAFISALYTNRKELRLWT